MSAGLFLSDLPTCAIAFPSTRLGVAGPLGS